MPDDNKTYVWVVEWNNPFAQHNNRGLLFYNVALRPDVKAEDFERFMKEEAFPAVDGILTRAIRFGPQYLLSDSAESGRDPLDISQVQAAVTKLESMATCTLDKRFLVVTGPESRPSEPD